MNGWPIFLRLIQKLFLKIPNNCFRAAAAEQNSAELALGTFK
jgi:hypothetical protein